MAKIQLMLEADTAAEMQDILQKLTLKGATPLDASDIVTGELKISDKGIGNPDAGDGTWETNDEEVTKKEEEAEKKSKKRKTTKKTKKTKASTAKTSADAPSSDDDPENEKSATAGQYPDATKADVQKAMKQAMDNGHRKEILTCFGRFNAKKLSDLAEEDYSAFLTDLDALAGE